MPVLPSQKNLISTDVPSAPSEGVSPVGSALANMGAQVEQSAYAVKEQLKRAEAVEASQRFANQDEIAADQTWQKLKDTSPDGYVYETNSDGSHVMDELGNKKRSKNSDGTDRTITQEFRDWANDRYEKTQLQLPSDMAQELYRDKSGKAFTNRIQLANSEEHTIRISAINDQQETTDLKNSTDIYDFPSSAKLYDKFDKRVQELNQLAGAQGIPASSVHDKVQKMGNQYSLQYVEGELRNIRTDAGGVKKRLQTDRLSALLDVVTGQPKPGNIYEGWLDPETMQPSTRTKSRQAKNLPAVTDMLSPQDRRRLADEILSAMSGPAKSIDKSALDSEGNGLKAAALVPERPETRGQFQQDYNSYIQKMNTALTQHVYEPVEYLQRITAVRAAQLVGEYMRSKNFAYTPAYQQLLDLRGRSDTLKNEIKALVPFANKYASTPETVTSTTAALGEADRTFQLELQGIIRNQDAKAKTNFPEFARETDPDLYASKMGTFNTQDLTSANPGQRPWFRHLDRSRVMKLGPEHAKNEGYLTSDEQEQLSKTIGSSDTPVDKLAQGLNQFMSPKGWDLDGVQVIRQMAVNGKIPQEWRFMPFYMHSQSLTEDMVQTLRDGDKLVANYKDTVAGKSKGSTWDDLLNLADQKGDPYFKSIMETEGKISGNTAGLVSSLRKVVATKAINTMKDGRIQPDEAIEGAIKDLFGTQEDIIRTGGGFLSGITKAETAVPKRTREPVFGPRASTSILPRRTTEGGQTLVIDDEARKSIAIYTDAVRRDPMQLVKDFGAVIPADHMAGSNLETFLKSGSANLHQVQIIDTGPDGHPVKGFGFVYTTRVDGSATGHQPLLRKDPDGSYHRVFIPYSQLILRGNEMRQANGGKGLWDAFKDTAKGAFAAPEKPALPPLRGRDAR